MSGATSAVSAGVPSKTASMVDLSPTSVATPVVSSSISPTQPEASTSSESLVTVTTEKPTTTEKPIATKKPTGNKEPTTKPPTEPSKKVDKLY